jgi:NADPH2:quinone reductase
VREFGGPEVLTPVDLPDPEPGAGQVVVGMAAADVIFLDTLLRGGWGQDFFPRTPPYVPGGGGAGTVVATGAGVDPAWTGRRVVVRTGSGYAERVVAAVGEVMPVPDGLGLEVAAALVHDGVTALDLTRRGKPGKGEWVLVSAAAGGAGSLLVQLAARAGSRVVAAASSAAKLALAVDLGAEETVDYTRPDWIARVRSVTGGGAALVYDGVGGKQGTATVDAECASSMLSRTARRRRRPCGSCWARLSSWPPRDACARRSAPRTRWRRRPRPTAPWRRGRRWASPC